MPKNHNPAEFSCSVCKHSFERRDLFPLKILEDALFDLIKEVSPNLEKGDYCCADDLNRFLLLFQSRKNSDPSVELETEVIESLVNQTLIAENVNEEYEESLSLGDRMADKLSSFCGSWRFILYFLGFIVFWMILNTVILFNRPLDPFPFILLNLLLSCLAAFQAPIIMMSQNRISAKDRLRGENDYQVDLKAELQIREINKKLDTFINFYKEEKMRENQALIRKDA